MAVTIGEVMRECRNFFWHSYLDQTFHIEPDGSLTFGEEHELLDGNGYIALQGSSCDDVYYCAEGYIEGEVVSQSFEGRVWFLNPTAAFLRLCSDIAVFDSKCPTGAFQSESFGEYSYTRASGSNGVLTWQEAFVKKLNPYRRMFTEVTI